jgi:1-deoxy-D-xylulose-5-phosphate synthase
LLTRKERFDTLREYKGISGFPNPEESEYDCFVTGHASTSISAALGFAKGSELKKSKENIIAVIGDGSLTGGEVYEALNHAGHIGCNLIVILNDNGMSISKNVGAISNYLSKLRVTNAYITARKDFQEFLEHLPKYGHDIFKFAKKIKDRMKYLVMPGIIFEELGFNYIGPIDGHNLEILIKTLNFAKTIKGPKFIHILTKKGKGYLPAENDATKFHGVSSFEIETGEIIKKDLIPTYTEIFSKTIVRLASENKNIVAITAAMREGTGLKEFSKIFPERFFDVGIAEQHAVTFAAGLAKSGFKPYVAIYSTFLQRAYDQILHDVCLQNLPVVFVIDRAGIVGEDGATHQGIFDLSYLRHIPNLSIMAPKDEEELEEMLKFSVKYQFPLAIRYPKGKGVGVRIKEDFEKIEPGKSEIITEGKDLIIFAIGSMVYPGYRAVKELEKEGIETTLVNARFLKPIDEETILNLTKKIDKMITVEENVLEGGMGSAVLEILAKNNIKIKVKCIGIPSEFVEHGPQEVLREKYGLSEEGIYRIAKKFLEKNS